MESTQINQCQLKDAVLIKESLWFTKL